MRSIALAALVFVSSVPVLAQAQIEALPPEAPAAVVVQPAPIEAVEAPPSTTASTSAPSAPVETTGEPEITGYSGLGMWMEQMNLGSVGLTLARPEVEALTGVQLGRDWAGNQALSGALLGGASLNVGMRAHGFLRGPELRLMVGGGDVGGDWAPAPGVDGLELSVQSVLLVRLEAAIGLQVPLGPVVPYVMGRAAVGGAIVDVAVRDARLGGLGTEHVDATVLELGIEAGVGFRLAPGLEMGVAFRGSFLGAESLGGMLTLGFDGSTQ